MAVQHSSSALRMLRRRAWMAAPVVVAAAIGFAALLASPTAAHAQTASEIFARVSSAVPVVETELGHGTGFVIDTNHVMTDAHVVGDAETVKVRFPDGAVFATAKVVARDWLVDMAVIEIAGTRAVPASIAAPPTVVGSELYVLGYPGRTATSPQPILSRGLVSQVSQWEGAGVTYIRTDANGEAGLSGGPVLDASGNIVGVIQFGSSGGKYMIAASAQDLAGRARRHLAGEDVDGITRRRVTGTSGVAFDVTLRGGAMPEQAFLAQTTTARNVKISVSASALVNNVLVSVTQSDGTPVGATVLGAVGRPVSVTVPMRAGKSYWLDVWSDSPAVLNVQSEIALVRFADPDSARAAAGRVVGLIDHQQDVDCRPIELRIGQKITARAESTAFDAYVYIASPSGATLVQDDDTAGGVLGNDAEVSLTARANGDHAVCVLANNAVERPTGYVLTITTAPPPPVPASAGSFQVAGATLSAARARHGVVTLRDGRVMVIDGVGPDGGALDSAEVYDPKAGTVAIVPARDVIARFDPSVALLADGRVLVVGGRTKSGITDVASVYDPADGSWRRVGPLGTARVGGEVHLLPDGRVLVATGSGARSTGGGSSLATAEVFSPTTGTFAPTGGLATARTALYGTRLADGRVLIAGGFETDATHALQTAEVYDPKASAFRPTGDLQQARYNHTSTLLPGGLVLVAGGSDGQKELTSAELYDPATGRFRTVGSLSVARQGHEASLLPDGRVLITGGWYTTSAGRAYTAEIGAAEIFDPRTEQFSGAGGPRTARIQSPALLPDGRVVLAGGSAADGSLDSIEIYTPGTASMLGSFAAPPVFSANGLAMVVFHGGTVEQLEATALAAGATGAWAQGADGVSRLLVINGPAFLSDAFRRAFAQGLADPAVVTLTR